VGGGGVGLGVAALPAPPCPAPAAVGTGATLPVVLPFANPLRRKIGCGLRLLEGAGLP